MQCRAVAAWGGWRGPALPWGVTVPLGRGGRGWELLECSQTHTVHQEPQPTDLCFLCNNQIKVLTETPWLCWFVLGLDREGRWECGAGICHPGLGWVTRGFPEGKHTPQQARGPCVLSMDGNRASPAMPSKGFQCVFPFLLFLKQAPKGLGEPGLTQGLRHSPALQHCTEGRAGLGEQERGSQPCWGRNHCQGRHRGAGMKEGQ